MKLVIAVELRGSQVFPWWQIKETRDKRLENMLYVHLNNATLENIPYKLINPHGGGWGVRMSHVDYKKW